MCLLFPPFQVQKYAQSISSAKMVVMDANVNIETMETVCEICRRYNVPGM